jgi:hypothetical protein
MQVESHHHHNHHHHHHHHHHHISVMELGHLLTRSGLTCPEVSSKVCHVSFCKLGNRLKMIVLITLLSSPSKFLLRPYLHVD